MDKTSRQNNPTKYCVLGAFLNAFHSNMQLCKSVLSAKRAVLRGVGEGSYRVLLINIIFMLQLC
jgi:hypothetical protein